MNIFLFRHGTDLTGETYLQKSNRFFVINRKITPINLLNHFNRLLVKPNIAFP